MGHFVLKARSPKPLAGTPYSACYSVGLFCLQTYVGRGECAQVDVCGLCIA